MRRYKKFLINGMLITITSLLMRSVGIAFNIYISNKIGAEAIGLFSLVMSVYLFMITLASSGINLATSRIIAEENALHPDFNSKKCIRNALFYSLTISLIASFLLCLFASRITSSVLHDKLPPYLLYIVAFSLPFIAMSSALNGYFTALRKAPKNAICRVFEQFVKILSTTYFISLFFPDGIFYACLSLVLGETISEVASFLFTYFLYLVDIKKSTSAIGLEKNYLKRILNITIPVSITSYIRSGLSSLKQILIPFQLERSGIACDISLAQYGKINGMAMQVLLFPEVLINSFSSLLVPEFAYYSTRKETKAINYIISKIFKVSLLYAVFIASIFFFYSEKLSLLIYQDLEIASYLKIICPLLLFMYLDSAVDSMLKGLDKQLWVMYCNILDSVVSIFLICFLVPKLRNLRLSDRYLCF